MGTLGISLECFFERTGQADKHAVQRSMIMCRQGTQSSEQYSQLFQIIAVDCVFELIDDFKLHLPGSLVPLARETNLFLARFATIQVVGDASMLFLP